MEPVSMELHAGDGGNVSVQLNTNQPAPRQESTADPVAKVAAKLLPEPVPQVSSCSHDGASQRDKATCGNKDNSHACATSCKDQHEATSSKSAATVAATQASTAEDKASSRSACL
jgi:hypothetical protein